MTSKMMVKLRKKGRYGSSGSAHVPPNNNDTMPQQDNNAPENISRRYPTKGQRLGVKVQQ